MPYQEITIRYLKSLQRIYNDSLVSKQHTAELSFRTPLDTFFKELADELNGSKDIVVILEPRNQSKMGRPDWLIHDRATFGVYGYIEAKGLSLYDFDIRPYEEQFNRYLTLGHKLIITDGIDFVFAFDSSEKPQIISLIDKSQLNALDWSRITLNPKFEVAMRRFFANPSPQYCDESKLVELVALRTRILSDEILRYTSVPLDEAMNEDEANVIKMLGELKELVYNHNDSTLRQDKVFADFAAQVIMFALLYAHRVECTDVDSPVEKESKIKNYLSRDIVDGQELRPFLTLIHFINSRSSANGFILTWTNECIRFLSFIHMKDEQRQRPDYHKLFELFLSKFDPQARFDYGAFYTPSELADCIVRLVEEIAKSNFDGASIFNDGNILIDPCCGTGSFLERIHQNDTHQGRFVLCGIEILPAPYMLANYRMAALNHELNGKCSSTELLLANALSDCVLGEEPTNLETIEGFELERVRELSSRPITLVIGNPPSSDSSKVGVNFSRIQALMNDFRPPINNLRSRQNIQKQINNPYLQFLRWGCEMLNNSDNHSILAYIVPATFLENESYKFARKYIAEHFSSAWIITVDADARAGIRSDSMFKTQQGRAILVATRKYGEDTQLCKFNYFDISHFAKRDKANWLEKNAIELLNLFTCHDVDYSNYTLRPSLSFNEELYFSYWPVSGDNEPFAIFNNHCSGIKLAPSSIFTHLKVGMLKRRSREIMQHGMHASDEWLGTQDKPPKEVEVREFANALDELGNAQAVDSMFNNNIKDYTFRPFLTMKAFLWQDLLQRFSRVGGGGTRRRPEIVKAYSDANTVGFSLAHSPKDQNENLKPFASFCWYYPDNDMCRRGNGYIYMNQYPKGRNNPTLQNNINEQLYKNLSRLLKMGGLELSTKLVFYVYAVLCSQVYLDEFEGALLTVSRSDLRPRIPMVKDKEVFEQLCELGRKVALLEKADYEPQNLADFDYATIKEQVPAGFMLSWAKNIQPFDEESETLTISDGKTNIAIHCPLDVQRLNIGGYEIIKNVWMKFNSYDFTHCHFTQDDMEGLLSLINKLLEYVALVGEIDVIMHDVIEGKHSLFLPNPD